MAPIYLFTCSICCREVRDWYIHKGPRQQVAPICLYCEGEYGERSPSQGSFMDRRLARQISALSNALCGEANAIDWKWRLNHGRA